MLCCLTFSDTHFKLIFSGEDMQHVGGTSKLSFVIINPLNAGIPQRSCFGPLSHGLCFSLEISFILWLHLSPLHLIPKFITNHTVSPEL